MINHYLLEISVENLEAAAAAERGGAHRIELCENLRVGGVTPGAELMRAARERVRLPIFAMIRPRGGGFLYSAAEYMRMLRAVDWAKECGMDGVVLGILLGDGTVDVQRTRELVKAAAPLPVTFHRAFDETADLGRALRDVIATGAVRVLTSGGKASAEEGAAVLAELVEAAGERIKLMPGGGINSRNLERVVRQTRASEFHSGLGTTLPYPHNRHEEFAREVRKLAEILSSLEIPAGEISPRK
jgi:copper homeostasis protein